mgnify:CR=1 FL=1
MRAIISITAVLSLFLLSSFTKEDLVFFENNKVRIYSNDNGIRFNYKFENFEELKNQIKCKSNTS